MAEFNVVVIGGGLNGLIASAYLAREGLKVYVAEKRHLVGGSCITEEVWPGFKLNRMAYVFPNFFLPEIIRDLRLKKYGFKALPQDSSAFTPFPDGRYLLEWSDEKRTCQEIRRFSAKNAEAYPKFLKFWSQAAKFMRQFLYAAPASLQEFASIVKTSDDEELVRRLFLCSSKQLLDEYFEDDYVKAALALPSVIGVFAGPMTAGTVYILGLWAYGILGGGGSYFHLKGGIGALTEAIAKSAAAMGVEIATGVEVEKILITKGRARGVKLSTGKIIKSNIILSDAAPQQTFMKLVGEEHLEKEFVRKIKRIRDEGCSVKFNAVIRELPDYKALPGKQPGPQHVGVTDISPSIEYLEKAFDEAKHGKPSTEPYLEITFPTVADPSLASQGYHIMSIYSQYFPYTLKSGNWDNLKDEVGNRILNILSDYAPNMSEAIVHREVITPLDMERIFSLPKGNIAHLEMTSEQLLMFRPALECSNYKTPIEGFYLCGQGTHPGTGIIGACGYNATRVVLKELRKQI